MLFVDSDEPILIFRVDGLKILIVGICIAQKLLNFELWFVFLAGKSIASQFMVFVRLLLLVGGLQVYLVPVLIIKAKVFGLLILFFINV